MRPTFTHRTLLIRDPDARVAFRHNRLLGPGASDQG